MIEGEDLSEMFDRLARTAEGQLLYRYFQKQLCSICTDPDEGALRRHEGRRMFAAELMGLMAKGIRESDRTAITFAVASPRAIRSARGAGRRVTADTSVPGWDTPGDASESGSSSSDAA